MSYMPRAQAFAVDIASQRSHITQMVLPNARVFRYSFPCQKWLAIHIHEMTAKQKCVTEKGCILKLDLYYALDITSYLKLEKY